MGPLAGVRIVEFGGIGPGPMCAMLLADLGADIIRIDRPVPGGLGTPRPDRYNLLNRSRRSVILDLKRPEGIDAALRLIERADALVEGFRPGTMERLGIGPQACLERNARLVYGRMTGWGQDGPLAMVAGHDLNYISLSGVLHSIGRKGGAPTPPLVLTGDYGGGALYLALGVLSGVIAARESGKGQVVDAAMVDGSASLMTSYYGQYACGLHHDERGTNVTDGGVYYWDVYQCADDCYVSIAPIEPKFRAVLIEKLGLADLDPPLDAMTHDEARDTLRAVFRKKTRDEWCAQMAGADACFAPVLSLGEAPLHPHNRARGTFIKVDGIVQPAPAPRFTGTPTALPTAPESPGASTAIALAQWGFDEAEIARLGADGVFGPAFAAGASAAR
ncbi:coA-transferase III family protein [Paraburkholderia fungorum]|uniref:CoA-transferase III family protein n=1 Tax=Paraburkholderia fungorum TaxID=134537 RepID=A0AAU8T966_9BURK|nr:CaiB/BaiF CoA-transferase family protein [Paraburkholderia fungorum]AJZ56740.1 coA-transferase III family protein [Paraburkholderia fungorum]